MRDKRGALFGMILLGLVAVALAAALLLQNLQRTDTASLQQKVLSIASELRAPGDENTSTVATSPSQTALHMRYEIQQALLAGNTRKEIIQQLVSEYGPQVYAAPPLIGFGTLLWVLPVLFLLALLWVGSRFMPQFRRVERQSQEFPEPHTSAVSSSAGRDMTETLREYL